MLNVVYLRGSILGPLLFIFQMNDIHIAVLGENL